MRRTLRPCIGLLALASVLLAACNGFGNLPWAPTITTASPGNASAVIAFAAPVLAGQSAISTYVASCTAAGETWSARGEASPLTVAGLTNGIAYACSVRASNAAGTGANSGAVTVTPRPDSADSLESGYRQAAWAAGMSVTFPNACTMTVWPSARPSHAVDGYYLTPVPTGKQPRSGRGSSATQVSALPLEVTPFQGPGAQEPMQFNICPTKALVPTAVNAGAVGVLISGSVLFGAAEIAGHRATTLKDNAAYAFKGRSGETITARFIDRCNGHPTPAYAGNGISSPTPEFPQGVYQYVLPSGVKERNASLRCYGGDLSRKELASADSSGFCYAPQAPGPNSATGKMAMGVSAKQ